MVCVLTHVDTRAVQQLRARQASTAGVRLHERERTPAAGCTGPDKSRAPSILERRTFGTILITAVGLAHGVDGDVRTGVAHDLVRAAVRPPVAPG